MSPGWERVLNVRGYSLRGFARFTQLLYMIPIRSSFKTPTTSISA
jgi:hypothetical protein